MDPKAFSQRGRGFRRSSLPGARDEGGAYIALAADAAAEAAAAAMADGGQDIAGCRRRTRISLRRAPFSSVRSPRRLGSRSR